MAAVRRHTCSAGGIASLDMKNKKVHWAIDLEGLLALLLYLRDLLASDFFLLCSETSNRGEVSRYFRQGSRFTWERFSREISRENIREIPCFAWEISRFTSGLLAGECHGGIQRNASAILVIVSIVVVCVFCVVGVGGCECVFVPDCLSVCLVLCVRVECFFQVAWRFLAFQ